MSAPARPFEVDLAALEALSESEREQAVADLRALRANLESNPLWAFIPHRGEQQYREEHGIPLTGNESRGQVEFLELTRRGVFLGAVVASNRFGKTHINFIDALIQTLPWELVPPWLAPYKVLDPAKRDVRIRFIGPDLNQWLAKSIESKMAELIPKAALRGGKLYGKGGAWNDRERKLTFEYEGEPIGWWDFLTHDMELDAFSSVELDRACFDEEPTGASGERQYDETIRGLVDREGDVRFTLTPVEGIGWLYSELFDSDDEPRRDEETHVVTGEIDHNPHLPAKVKAKVVERWKRAGEYDQRAKGLFKHREGLIFPEYQRRLETGPLDEQPGGHLRSDRTLRQPSAGAPGKWAIDPTGQWRVPVFEAMDPGINVEHPFAFTVAFLNTPETDPYGLEDVLEIFHCYKQADGVVAEHADYILRFRATLGYQPQFTVIDPAAQNRNPETGRKLQEAYRRAGINTVLGQNDRALTYAELRGRLVAHRLRVWTSADVLFGDEMKDYRWKRASGRTEDVARPEPIKRKDDLIDTVRYMVLRIPVWRGGRSHGPEEDEDPRRRLAREHIKSLRNRRKRAKVGGVW